MKRERHNEEQNDLFDRIEGDVQTERYCELMKHTEQGYHPPREYLHGYTTGELEGKERQIIQRHIAFCRKCAQEIGAIMRTEQEVEQEILEPEAGEPEIMKPFERPLKERIEWFIEETGQALTAATRSVTSKKQFHTRIGSIEITCTWGQEGDGETFTRIDWRSEPLAEGKFAIHLLNAVTREILSEVSPETIQQGTYKNFTARELGLDPLHEKLAIDISILETDT